MKYRNEIECAKLLLFCVHKVWGVKTTFIHGINISFKYRLLKTLLIITSQMTIVHSKLCLDISSHCCSYIYAHFYVLLPFSIDD